jgi:hypothetical protein
MEIIITGTTSTSALTALFTRGEVYADSWSREVRERLNVNDPLADVVVEALDSGRHVVITGNAGDGKSHLLETALDRSRPRQGREVEADASTPANLTPDHRVFIRDAATIDDARILVWTEAAMSAGAQLVITLNEGPLISLADHQAGGFYRRVRDAVHARARGEEALDPEGVLLLNLAGRQLVQTDFVAQALERLLPAVTPCPACGHDVTCPRTAGRDLLAAAPQAADRIALLLRLIGHSGTRLTARELWVFLADLFFGWECPPRAKEVDQLPGWWWSRVFDTGTLIGRVISREFDPIHTAQAAVDNHLWLGNSARAGLPAAVTPYNPSRIHRRDAVAALRAFESAKRAWFFLADELDALAMIDRQSEIPEYVRLVEDASDEPERVARRIVAEVNRYRLRVSESKRLHLSRHHRLTVVRRPTLMAASESIPASSLSVRLPYRHEGHGVDQAGFAPTRLELSWAAREGSVFGVDYQTWKELRQLRSTHANRTQEALDAALDLFLSQAPVEPERDPEIIAVDHATGTPVKISVRGGKRPMFEVTE